MTGEVPPALQREGLLLFGRFCAGLSHEISNVFNIINELAGLELDIARAAEREGGAPVARVIDLAGRIKVQVARGEELNRLLHRLGHVVDSARVTFDLGELLVLVGALEARAARLARVELAVTAPERPVTLEGDPFALLLALDACIGGAVAKAGDGRRVEVRGEASADGIRLVVDSADPLGDPSTSPALRLGVAAWGATTAFAPETGAPHRVVLELPHNALHAQPDRAGPSVEES